MTLTEPPHCAQVSTSMLNTLFKRWAQVMALRFSSGVLFSSCRLFPRRAVVTRVLCLLFGANTPWNRVRLTRGFGTSEASFAMKSNDSNITCVVPSLARCEILEVCKVPEAEVNLGILNVCFGGVGYQGVTGSEAEYIGRGPRGRLMLTPGNTLAYIFF